MGRREEYGVDLILNFLAVDVLSGVEGLTRLDVGRYVTYARQAPWDTAPAVVVVAVDVSSHRHYVVIDIHIYAWSVPLAGHSVFVFF